MIRLQNDSSLLSPAVDDIFKKNLHCTSKFSRFLKVSDLFLAMHTLYFCRVKEQFFYHFYTMIDTVSKFTQNYVLGVERTC